MGILEDRKRESESTGTTQSRKLPRLRLERSARNRPENGNRNGLRRFLLLLQNLKLAEIFHRMKHRLSSESLSYCLRRDLTIPIEMPKAKIPIRVRTLEGRDIRVLLNLGNPDLSDQERRELTDRLIFVKEGVRTCYVGVDDTDTACYMQWLIGPNENLNLRRIFHGGFPWLEPDEALLEDAFTPESHRGLGIMSCAMAQIAEHGSTINARYILTFVHDKNIPSLKGCKRAGFIPYKLRSEKNFLFRRTITFTPLPPGTPYPFDTAKPA